MEIILWRHGKAEERAANKKDAKRALTRRGVKEMQMFLVAIKNAQLLQLNWDKTVIWSSPLVRAQETAALLAKAWGVEVVTQDCLATGEMADFVQAFAAVHPEMTVVLVGHEPYLSAWYQAITGKPQVFAKGAYARLRVDSTRPLIGKAMTYVAPADFFCRADVDYPVVQALGKGLQAIAHEEERFLQEPAEPESVHQLRVKIRFFRSLLSFFKPFLSRKVYRTYQEKWRAYGHELALLREMDVLLETWHEMLEQRQEFSQAFSLLSTHLSTLRFREQERVEQLVAGGWWLRVSLGSRNYWTY